MLTISILFAVVSSSRREPTKAHPNDSLFVPKDELYFGEIWAESNFEWPITFVNPTRQAIIVEGIKTSCRCTSIDRSSFTVWPGKAEKVTLTLDFGSSLTSTRNEVRDFRVIIIARLRAGDTTSRKSWYLKGSVRQVLSASDPLVNLSVDPITPLSNPFYTELFSNIPLDGIDVSLEHPGVVADLQLTSAKTARMKLDLNKRWFAQNSSFYRDVVIHTEASLTPRYEEYADIGSLICRIPIDISVKYDVGFIPNVLSYGPIQIGEDHTRSVTLKSRSERVFTVNKINIIGQGVNVTKAITPNGLEYFVVSKTASGIGQEIDFVEFVVEDGREIPYAIRLQLSSVGVN